MIFCDFWPIFSEKIGVFSQKPLLLSINKTKQAVVLSKNANFGAKIFLTS
jgi:hypothetical protein